MRLINCLTFSLLFSLAALWGTAQPAAAQSTLPLSPALACLSTVDGGTALPVYPDSALSRREGGTLRVQLVFSGPDMAPNVTIVSRPPMGFFDDAVTRHVNRFRVPCMRSGDGAVTLTQDYVFDPDQRSRVIARPPRDNADPVRAAQLKCMAHKDGEKLPEYPREALNRRTSGTIVVRLRFTGADTAPTMEIVQAMPSNALRRAVAAHVAGMRVPCLGERPLETLFAFKYLLTNRERVVLRDVSLVEALAAARDLKTPVHFDFRNMHCPFELRISYHQPFAPNTVQQLDADVPAREPFMDWLAGLTLDMPAQSSANVFHDKFIVEVPCTSLTL